MNSTHTASGPPDKARPAAHQSDGPSPNGQQEPPELTGHHHTRHHSQQVAWREVFMFCRNVIARLLHVDTDTAAALIARGPFAGTPEWMALADGDPLKLAAALAYSPHHSLRIDAAQSAMADTGSEISAAADWSVIGQRVRERTEWIAAHPWARRISA
jgi:hypothetical protein